MQNWKRKTSFQQFYLDEYPVAPKTDGYFPAIRTFPDTGRVSFLLYMLSFYSK